MCDLHTRATILWRRAEAGRRAWGPHLSASAHPSAPPLCRQAVATQGGWAMEPRADRLLRGGALPLLHAPQGAAPAAACRRRAAQRVHGAAATRRARAVRQAYTAVPGQERRPGRDYLGGEDDRAAAAGAPRTSK
eukprot:scaffold78838_cov58-Phaeocystis_antarctica.AAC.4